MTNISVRFKKAYKKGFSLIELMVVAVVIAVLSASLMPRFIDMNKASEAKDEYAKITELRSRIQQLYANDLNFSGVSTVWLDQLPSSYKKSGTKVYSVWKNEVKITESGQGFQIEYLRVPKGTACTELAKQSRSSGWHSVLIDGKVILAETSTKEIGEWCKLISAKDVVSSYKFIHDTTRA